MSEKNFISYKTKFAANISFNNSALWPPRNTKNVIWKDSVKRKLLTEFPCKKSYETKGLFSLLPNSDLRTTLIERLIEILRN